MLVRIEASGVCHSDLHRIHGDFPSPLPMVMGHEGSGVVEQVGPGVGSPQVGDHVVLSIGPYCGECLACGAGRFSDCPKIAAMRPLGALFDGTSRLSKGGERISNQSFVSSFAEYSGRPRDRRDPRAQGRAARHDRARRLRRDDGRRRRLQRREGLAR